MRKPPKSEPVDRSGTQADGADGGAVSASTGVGDASHSTGVGGASDTASVEAASDATGDSSHPALSTESIVTDHIVDANSADDHIELDLVSGYAQRVNWGVPGAQSLVIDEPAPLGGNTGPSPGRVLAAALASCLGASLMFCLKRSRIDVLGLHSTATTELKRNEQGRLRVGSITVRLEPVVTLEQQPRMARCLEMFEDYCIVTASVRPSVTVNVTVHPVAPTADTGADAG